jgi:mono/diheme cytochrome c family protein
MVPGALLPLFLLVPTAGLHLASGGVGSGRAAGEVEFGRDVRPILTEHCFACHGPDEAAREGDLRLDEEAAARASGVFEGELVRRISLDADHPAHMPPAELGKPLTAQQVQVLTDWVAAGAPYDRHWSFRTPERPGLPEVQEHEWVRNPVDTFVLARLEEEGLAPAPEADRRSLARRLSLDLTGLPPDPAEVEAFVQDPRPDAYERLVERWLASDAWGEHRARGWLDVARYADTHGIHFDNYRDIWPYRDWVIEAFAADVPYDTFSIEQLAGDLRAVPRPQVRPADPARVLWAVGVLRQHAGPDPRRQRPGPAPDPARDPARAAGAPRHPRGRARGRSRLPRGA